MVQNMRMEHVTDKLLEVHFSISNEELEFINKARGYINQLGVAVCLKVYIFLGCLPKRKDDIPEQIINWIAKQLNRDSNIFEKYIWQSRSWMRHLLFIREFTGFRAYET